MRRERQVRLDEEAHGRAVMGRVDTIVEMAQEDPEAITHQPRNLDLRRAWQRS